MRNYFALFLLVLCCSMLQNCEKESFENFSSTEKTQTRSTDQYGSSQVIIRYEFDYSDEIKEILRLKYANSLDIEINFIEYSEWDNKLEMWNVSKIDNSDINVNDLVTSMKTKEFDEGELEGNPNSNLKLGTTTSTFNASDESAMEYHFAAGSGPVIAIIDSGLDYGSIPGRYLYKSDSPETGIVSGWDFVNDDFDVRDDFGHGTHLAKIILDELAVYNIKPKFVPIKAFNDEGKTSLFGLLKALAYVNAHDDFQIVNLSLGYLSKSKYPVLEDIMNEVAEHTLIICSAGNDGLKTDSNMNTHYPSGLSNDQIIAVGGYVEPNGTPITSGDNVLGVERAEDSNYGKIKVDLFAPFDQYEVIYPGQDNPTYLQGTSYSAAFTSARAAILYEPDYLIPTWREAIIMSGYNSLPLKNKCQSGRAIIRNEIN